MPPKLRLLKMTFTASFTIFFILIAIKTLFISINVTENKCNGAVKYSYLPNAIRL